MLLLEFCASQRSNPAGRKTRVFCDLSRCSNSRGKKKYTKINPPKLITVLAAAVGTAGLLVNAELNLDW